MLVNDLGSSYSASPFMISPRRRYEIVPDMKCNKYNCIYIGIDR